MYYLDIAVPERQRNQGGKFVQKSDEMRKVRSVRLTDTAWNELGRIADERDITRADLIEELIEKGLAERLEDKVESSKQLELPFGVLPKLERADLEEKRDRALAALKLGSQAPLYKKIKKALDTYMKMLLD
jgi:predicted DNA-binding protein